MKIENKTVRKQTFGDTLFGGNRFIFWCLGPLFLLTGIVFAANAYSKFAEGRPGTGGILLSVAFLCICFFLALLNGRYFWWAGRLVAISVFCAYVWYLVDTWLIQHQAFELGSPRGGSTPWNALCGLIIIGWPCLCYTFLGRFSFRAPPSPIDDPFENDAFDDDASNEKRG